MEDKLNEEIINSVKEICNDEYVKKFIIKILIYESDRSKKSRYKDKYIKEVEEILEEWDDNNEI